MLLIDLTHTSHTRARTGVQRVCRSLLLAAQKQTVTEEITYDPYERKWRRLQSWENENLRSLAPAGRRSAKWPWQHRFTGQLQRIFSDHTDTLSADTLLVPEIFSAENAVKYPELFRKIRGPKIAIFHDAIALKFPELTPQKTVARFPSYLQELLVFDAITAVSEDSRQTLIEYWRWLGVHIHPPVRTIPLGSAPAVKYSDAASQRSAKPLVLSVGSIEGRKNHLALLQACENLWKKGRQFQLQLIGISHRETGRSALEKISALQHAGFDLRYEGAVSEAVLNNAYDACSFTVYPSLMEGFGLPVLESVSHGKPCICSARGALGEAALGGGCLTCDPMDVANLGRSIEALLVEDPLRAKLTAEALARGTRSWDDYAADLIAWSKELPNARSIV